MPSGGTITFVDPADYQASFRAGRIKLVFIGSGVFKARLTWVELPNLHLFCSQEDLPRIACVSLTPGLALLAFATNFASPPTVDGAELHLGDIVLHSPGERVHQRTRGTCRWAFIALDLEYLAKLGEVQTGRQLRLPLTGRIWRPHASATARLRHLHAKACRLAETEPDVIRHREVGRTIEQDLIHALASCLTEGDALDYTVAMRHHANIVARFEDVLTSPGGAQLHLPDLCAAIRVPERSLRVACAKCLGMSPSRYGRLLRLNTVRAALRRADPATASVAELAKRQGFSEPGRFAAYYRTVFGETPSTTLRHPSSAHSPASAEFA